MNAFLHLNIFNMNFQCIYFIFVLVSTFQSNNTWARAKYTATNTRSSNSES